MKTIDHALLREGDVVRVRATVITDPPGGRGPSLDFGFAHFAIYAAGFHVVEIEKPNFQVGDRVIADGHPGVILAVWPDGELLWVKPDGGSKRPWTVETAKCRREPAPPPSAEILPFNEASQRPCDTEAAE